MATGLTPELAKSICELLERGNSITQTGLALGIPHTTIQNWYFRNVNPEFTKAYDEARQRGVEHEIDQIVEIADAPFPRGADKDEIRAEEARRKLMIDVRKFRLVKILPKKFGDHLKVDAEISGGLNVNVTMRPPAKE